MNERDLALIDSLAPHHPELSRLFAKHAEYEARLGVISSKRWQTPQETEEAMRLKRLKLFGRDRMDSILSEHRRKESLSA